MSREKLKAWIHALRLRTLPLSVAGVLMGSILSAYHGKLSVKVFTLATITTLLLQILSNLANDYGDFKNGVDNDDRVGPTRAVQSGVINPSEMKRALKINSLLILLSGFTLLFVALDFNLLFVLFFVIGILALLAALKYTIGESNYGYHGYGDIMVFIFFGLVAVIGTFFLHTHSFDPWIVLPAVSVGLLSTGVLNINNMRDVENDEVTGKITIAVRLKEKSRIYHQFLVLSALISIYIFLFHYRELLTSSLLIIPSVLLFKHLKYVLLNKEPKLLDPQLKFLSMTTLLIVIMTGVILI